MVFFILIFVVLIWMSIDLTLGAMKRRKNSASLMKEISADLDFVSDGDDFFRILLKDLDAAEKHIHMMFFILRDDKTGNEFIDKLCEKASSGVSVKLLVDYIGSKNIKKSTIRKMKECGIHFSYSRKATFPLLFTSLNERNHRKITVIDGKVGYMGGFNIGKEYAGKDPKFGYWRDYHLRFQGEAVYELQKQFLSDWTRENNATKLDDDFFPSLPEGNATVNLHITNGSNVEGMFISLIDQAVTSIYIGTPYYIPGANVQKSILRAVGRGVNVKIILPIRADHPFVQEASFPYLVELIEAGCDIHQYMNGFFHAKVLLVDDHVCDIGTANFDMRSFTINGEINCIFRDQETIRKVKETIERDIVQSEPLHLKRLKDRTVKNRLIGPIARALSPFL
ncbi:cardiolipin synthase [Guptibacillus algicola]|uniref:cardiolipin synthase n=1 Tax=Guptibacillus algicola TaxID=225844 RepID=UPI001CD1EBB3|nr:cardiolipin synthase [Alkalihalobacillus algicola]MCA0988958.1 cardiolipin synthase [Alkalihalobacillus algicola]